MNLLQFYNHIKRPGVPEVVVQVDLATQQKLRTAISLAEDSKNFKEFEEMLGEEIKDFIKNTNPEDLKLLLESVLAIRRYLD